MNNRNTITLAAALGAIGTLPFMSSGPSQNGEADQSVGAHRLRRERRSSRRTSGTPEQNAERIAKAVAKRARKAALRLERVA